MNRPGPPPLSGDSAKSPASTPVTSSPNVTPKTSVWLPVNAAAGLLLSIEVTAGGLSRVAVGAPPVRRRIWMPSSLDEATAA